MEIEGACEREMERGKIEVESSVGREYIRG